jgi:hypothetical protein
MKYKRIRQMLIVDGRAVFEDEFKRQLPRFWIAFCGGSTITADAFRVDDLYHNYGVARAFAIADMEAPWHAYHWTEVYRETEGGTRILLDTVGPWEAWPLPRCRDTRSRASQAFERRYYQWRLEMKRQGKGNDLNDADSDMRRAGIER